MMTREMKDAQMFKFIRAAKRRFVSCNGELCPMCESPEIVDQRYGSIGLRWSTNAFKCRACGCEFYSVEKDGKVVTCKIRELRFGEMK